MAIEKVGSTLKCSYARSRRQAPTTPLGIFSFLTYETKNIRKVIRHQPKCIMMGDEYIDKQGTDSYKQAHRPRSILTSTCVWNDPYGILGALDLGFLSNMEHFICVRKVWSKEVKFYLSLSPPLSTHGCYNGVTNTDIQRLGSLTYSLFFFT